MSQLDDIRARAEAATAGPWEIVPETEDRYVEPGDECDLCKAGDPLVSTDHYDGWSIHHHEEKLHDIYSPTGQITGNYDYEIGGILETADTEFIAHARQDVPRLLAALDAVLALHVPEPPVQLKNGFLDVEPNCAGCIADCWDCEGVHFYADCPVRKAITEALEAS